MRLFSVCIPTYNAALTIKSTIQSVLNAGEVDFEIVVSDDASMDETIQIVEAFSDDRISVYRNPTTLGVPANWNQALKRARGDYVGLLNHDDLYGPFWLTFAAYIFQKYPHIDWVSTAFRVIDAKDKTRFALARFNQTGEVKREDAFVCAAKLDGLSPVYLVRRYVLEQVGFYDETAGPGADNELFLRLAAYASLYYSNNPHHAAWRLHHANLTHQWGVCRQVEEGLRVLDKTFRPGALPSDLHKYKDFSYAYNYKKVLKQIVRLLEQEDIAGARCIIEILHERVCKLY